MNETTLKQNIEQSLKLFNQRNLYDNSINLLKNLGYLTNRSLKFEPNTFESFLDIYPNAKNLNKDKALVSDWASIDFLFQLKAEDIMNVSQGKFVFDHQPRVDNQIIESYLFISISLKGSMYSRTQLANLTREINKIFQIPVMIIIQHGDSLTFSIIHRRLNKKDESRDVLEKVTLIKDISIKKPHRGHIEILFDLSLHQLAKDKPFSNFVELQKAWEKTLDTSELNKKFYKEIANWYFSSQNKVSFPDGSGDDVEVRNATNLIRLITRLIFVWFIKEKGLVPDDLFDQNKLKDFLNFSDPSDSTYYKAILQNLFFATLNTEMGTNRRFRGKNKNPNGLDSHYGISSVYRYEKYFKDSQEALSLFLNIPFLNGGLFECLDKREEKIIIDGFSDDPRNQPVVPDELFFGFEHDEDLSDFYGEKNKKSEKVRGIINIFSDYKFTIEENTPVEEEIALDPELLGRVFENLLASYNPETGTTARKQTGSFYTPREIVNYMVDEALIEYVKTKFGNLPKIEERLRHLFEYNQEDHKFTQEETRKLINAIDDVNVLDPACGSGAFPMGVLHKLVYILNKLDPGNNYWKEKQLTKAIEIPDPDVREKVISEIEQTFEENDLDYGRKLFLIENCIYGVDIQPIAVQIAKLRFFISLVVDQISNIKKNNIGIRPLPNLETKFVTANSLIGIDRPQQLAIRSPLIDEVEKRLTDTRSSLFTARTPSLKRKYRDLDRELRSDLAKLLQNDGWGSTSALKISSWDPYDQNSKADFFDPEWMFGIRNGFDIIIGNPPYLESRHPSFDEKLKLAYQNSTLKRWNSDSKYITKGADLLIYFLENSIFQLNNNGCVVMITQNSWLDTEYGRKFQQFLLKKTHVFKVVDSDYRYFPKGEGPNINTVVTIFLGRKPKKEDRINFVRYHSNLQEIKIEDSISFENKSTSKFKCQTFNYSNPLLSENKWGLLLNSSQELLNVFAILRERGKKLAERNHLSLSIGQGLNLSKNYIISEEIINSFSIPNNAQIPILTSEDGALFNINRTIYYLLDKSKLQKQMIKNLSRNGIFAFDTSSTTKKPPKLILPRGVNNHFCALNSINCFSSSGVDLYDNENSASPKEILNIWLFLNSSLGWLIREVTGRKNLGGGLLKAEAVDLENIPIYLNFDNHDEITNIFNEIKTRHALSTIDELNTVEHKKIDQLVFDFLELTTGQRDYIIKNLTETILVRNKKSTT